MAGGVRSRRRGAYDEHGRDGSFKRGPRGARRRFPLRRQVCSACVFGWAPGAILGSRVGSKVSTPVASKNMQGLPRLRLPSPHFSLSSHWPQVDGRTLRSLAIFLKTGFSGFQVSQERSSKAISVRQAIDLPIDYYRAGYSAKAAQEYYTYMGGSLGGNRHFTSVLPRLCGNWGCLRPKGCIWYRLRPRTYSTPT